jgi:hypothetical protein
MHRDVDEACRVLMHTDHLLRPARLFSRDEVLSRPITTGGTLKDRL